MQWSSLHHAFGLDRSERWNVYSDLLGHEAGFPGLFKERMYPDGKYTSLAAASIGIKHGSDRFDVDPEGMGR
jgi:hypothetical protein